MHHDLFSQSIVPRGESREKSVKFGNFRVAGTIQWPPCGIVMPHVHALREFSFALFACTLYVHHML